MVSLSLLVGTTVLMRIIINLPAEYEILPMSTTKHRKTANLIFQRAAFSKTE